MSEIECTLGQAIIHCQTKGGRARLACDPNGWYDVSDFEDRDMRFSADLIAAPWIWEPPKQSAFQQSLDNYKNSENYPDRDDCFKGGWNTALDKAIELQLGAYHEGSEAIRILKSLKE